jgi:hypothetical protein
MKINLIARNLEHNNRHKFGRNCKFARLLWQRNYGRINPEAYS